MAQIKSLLRLDSLEQTGGARYNYEKLSKTYSKSLNDTIEKRESRDVLQKVGSDPIIYIRKLDPTPDGKWVEFIIKSYLAGGIKKLEDISSRIIQALKKYEVLLKKRVLSSGEPKKTWTNERDLNNFLGKKGQSNIEDLIDKYASEISKLNKTSAESSQKKKDIYKDTVLIFENDKARVVSPKTKDSACYFGQGTRWCTAARENNMFEHYSKSGDIKIILPKKPDYPQEKYQYHVNSGQFMDDKDRQVDPDTILEKYDLDLQKTGDIKNPRILFLIQNKQVLEEGADPNIKNEYGETPLHNARTAEIAKSLLDFGADPNIKDIDGITPLHNTYTAEIAKLLLGAGADPNIENADGITPLHNAYTAEIAKLLLDSGADPNIRDMDGNTPLDYAETVEIKKLLLDAGAVPNS